MWVGSAGREKTEGAMRDELSRFVHDALREGHSKEEIRSILLEAGWPKEAIDKALEGYADIAFPIPVPRPRPYVSAREAFFYLVMFATLYASAVSFGSIVFSIIDHFIPDPASFRSPEAAIRSVRWAASWLLISFPVYLWLARSARVSLRQDPEKRGSRVRKWLTYLTLFVAAVVIIGDLVSLVYNLLSGELTLRFVLKVLTVGGIAGAVFGYYSRDLRDDELSPEELRSRRVGLRLLAGCVIACVLVAFVAGLFIAGSPGQARAGRLDDERVNDLRSIASSVDEYWGHHGSPPPDLESLAEERGLRLRSIRDPQSGEPYEYRVLTDTSYELCATFSASSSDSEARGPGVRFWKHEAGRTCFEIEVRSED
jgi:hypothetical protein